MLILDMISPLFWVFYDPILMIVLIILVCALTIVCRKIINRKDNHK